MRIAIIGAGGVGGYYGARLAAAGTDVTFVARGAHLAAMLANGLRVLSPMGDLHLPHVSATDDPVTVGPVDCVFFTVKQYDSEQAAALIPPLLGPSTVVIPFQNGVESVAMLTRHLDPARVAGGTTYIGSVVESPGVIRHTTSDRLIFGEMDGTRSPRLERLHDACVAAGIHPTLSDRIEVEIWTKFCHLTVFSGMTSVTRLPVGPIREDPDLAAMWQAALLESLAVARSRGIALAHDFVEDTMTFVHRWPPHMKSSLLQDLERGRRLELPWLSGAVVRLGKEVGVDAPVHRFITTVLGPFVQGRPR